MKTALSVSVEVSSTFREIANGNRLQVIYIDNGGKYPSEDSLFVDKEKGPLEPGHYVATQFYKKGYDWVIDFRSMQKAKS